MIWIMMSCTIGLCSIQLLEKSGLEVLDFLYGHNWLFWNFFWIGISNMQEFLYLRIFIEIFIVFIVLLIFLGKPCLPVHAGTITWGYQYTCR